MTKAKVNQKYQVQNIYCRRCGVHMGYMQVLELVSDVKRFELEVHLTCAACQAIGILPKEKLDQMLAEKTEATTKIPSSGQQLLI